jgi:hypothetical protein
MPAESLLPLLTAPYVMLVRTIGTEETRIDANRRITALTVVRIGFCNIVLYAVLVTAGPWCVRPVPKSHSTEAHPLALEPWIIHSRVASLG